MACSSKAGKPSASAHFLLAKSSQPSYAAKLFPRRYIQSGHENTHILYIPQVKVLISASENELDKGRETRQKDAISIDRRTGDNCP